jgi:hypothetical protein
MSEAVDIIDERGGDIPFITLMKGPSPRQRLGQQAKSA